MEKEFYQSFREFLQAVNQEVCDLIDYLDEHCLDESEVDDDLPF